MKQFVLLLFMAPMAQAYMPTSYDIKLGAAEQISQILQQEVVVEDLDHLTTITNSSSDEHRIHMLALKDDKGLYALHFFKESERVDKDEMQEARLFTLEDLVRTENPKGKSIYQTKGIDALFMNAAPIAYHEVDLDIFYLKSAFRKNYEQCHLRLVEENSMWSLYMDDMTPVNKMHINIKRLGIKNMGIPCEA